MIHKNRLRFRRGGRGSTTLARRGLSHGKGIIARKLFQG
ncbi:hypothetical protein USDA257_c46220 [Sinorhizobium fredii USDA 257]|uniref:Uncharacterized protein n=1 Tax=Sinorhizobium fredii (strain USDA 257) TaxID=1185652 RepID=I3XBA4_SINF2|nr:hypothetical protein USDA257_c46220 [Sinorhizobium fredii USDA 257]